MENNNRRLLKDLPFENLEKGDVISRGNKGFGGEFSISGGQTFYEGGGSSDRGLQGFNDKEEDILREIWDNEEWFADADLKHIDLIPATKSITLRFEPIDIEEAEILAKGIIKILPHLQDGSYAWNKFKNITTQIKNN